MSLIELSRRTLIAVGVGPALTKAIGRYLVPVGLLAMAAVAPAVAAAATNSIAPSSREVARVSIPAFQRVPGAAVTGVMQVPAFTLTPPAGSNRGTSISGLSGGSHVVGRQVFNLATDAGFAPEPCYWTGYWTWTGTYWFWTWVWHSDGGSSTS